MAFESKEPAVEMRMMDIMVDTDVVSVGAIDKEPDVPKKRLSWKESFNRKFFADDVPRDTQLWRRENLAIPLTYLVVGTFEGLSSTVINLYPLELGATPAQQATVKILRTLPASFKIIFGFISDGFPVFGYRRKMYMLSGWSLAIVSCLTLALIGEPTIDALSLLVFLFSLGFWSANVMGDSLVAEKAKIETEEQRGQLQSTCYACRFFMLMITVTMSTFLYEYVSPQTIFAALALIAITVMLPAIWFLKEERYGFVAPISDQVSDIWSAVSSRAVWQPMGFVYIYNIFQVGNAAWNQFLFSVLGFSSLEINSFLIAAYTLIFLGIMVYKRFLRHFSWRKVYLYTTILETLFSLLQFVLIFRLNQRVGISDYVFALGDDVFAEFINGIQFLPMTIMMVHLTPDGSEGAAYAMFTTVNNVALNLSGTLSTVLLGIWDVSREALEKEPADTEGFWKLSALTTGIQLSAIAFLPLLPRSKADLQNMDLGFRSKLGGGIFLGVLGVSLVATVTIAILNVVTPDWITQ